MGPQCGIQFNELESLDCGSLNTLGPVGFLVQWSGESSESISFTWEVADGDLFRSGQLAGERQLVLVGDSRRLNKHLANPSKAISMIIGIADGSCY